MKLFLEKKITSQSITNRSLLEVKDMTFDKLIETILKPDEIIGFSTDGKYSDLEEVITQNLVNEKGHYVFIVGGFQSGHFSKESIKRMNKVYSISRHHLEAHVVISRLIYECEKFLFNQNPNH
jgi:rRNA small subunit pseudouridine methyltransferase Nep1